MNRDISQLINVLMQMQLDIGSQRAGLAGLHKEIERLSGQIRHIEPDRLAISVTSAAAKAAEGDVARAADYAKESREAAANIAALMAPEPRRRRRWKQLSCSLAMLICLLVGAVSSQFVAITRPSVCRAVGGDWASNAGISACLFH